MSARLTRRGFTRAVAALACLPGAALGATGRADHFGFGLLPLAGEADFAAWRAAWARVENGDGWLDAFADAFGDMSGALDAAKSEAALDAIAERGGFDAFIDHAYEEAFREEAILRLAYPDGPVWIGRADPDYIR